MCKACKVAEFAVTIQNGAQNSFFDIETLIIG